MFQITLKDGATIASGQPTPDGTPAGVTQTGMGIQVTYENPNNPPTDHTWWSVGSIFSED